MSIKLGQGFRITSTEAIDTRLVLTKTQMAAMNDNLMPQKYFALCSDDNQIYYYDKSATASSETGKFTAIGSSEGIIIRGYYMNDKFYTDSTYTVECEKSLKKLYVDQNGGGGLYTWDGTQYNRSVKSASDTVAGILKLYKISGQNEDGTMTQKAITDGVQSIKFNIDEDDDECLILDLP